MKCEGAGKAPKSLYKAIRHYNLRDGKPWYHRGRGECAHCGGCYAVIKKGNLAVIHHHQDVRTISKKRHDEVMHNKSYWQNYYDMNHITGGTTGVYGGQIGQYFNVVETSGTTRFTQTYSNSTYQSITPNEVFRVEVESNTQNELGEYVFNINDSIYVSSTRRMSLAVDYVSWNAWNSNITTSNYARIEMGNTWHNWTTGTTPIQAYTYNDQARVVRDVQRRQAAYTRPIEDPVVAQERLQREREALFQRVEAERLAKDEAVARANETLLSLLTPEQRREYRERKQFHMRGSKGTLYRIIHGSSGNVRQVLSEADEGRGLHAFCAHPQMRIDQRTADEAGITPGGLPHEDAMIAQMLQLMVDEDEFLAVANRHW